MKNIRYRWRGAALCLTLSLMAAGCSMNDDLECPPEQGKPVVTGSAYLQLSLSMTGNSGTRADNPTGGEHGDGDEPGQTYENDVNSVVAFLFKHSDKGIEADGKTDVHHVEFTDFKYAEPNTNSITTMPEAVKDIELNTDYDVIIMANPGDDDWWRSASNLHQVRDHIQKNAWKEDGQGGYSDFLMSSAKATTQPIHITNTSTYTSPVTASVDIERMAARVDYNAEGEYTCNGTDYPGAKVTIEGAAIINRFTAGSYLLKRVADAVNVDPENPEEVEYLGDETSVAGGKATNYVLDPWTAQKTEANLTGEPFLVDGKTVGADSLYAEGTYYPERNTDPAWWADKIQPCPTVTDVNETYGVKTWQRVGYTLENTTSDAETTKAYNTGVAFKAKFEPQGVAGYKPGNTFFTYNGVIYPMLTDMMGQLNGQEDFSTYVGDSIAALTSWDDLKDFAASITNDPTGYSTYLEEYADTHSAEAFNTSDELKWEYYLSYELGVFEDSRNGPQINKNNINTRDKLYTLSDEKIFTYYEGRCYYIWWLRHSNNDDDKTNGLMEYAIVRNNIYKINVTDIYTLGSDIPESEEIEANVYVNKWRMLKDEELHM